MSNAQETLAQMALASLGNVFTQAGSRPEITHDERLQLMGVYASGVAGILRALRKAPAPRKRLPSVDDSGERSAFATEAPWLLIEAQALLVEVDSDRAKAWLERFNGAVIPMLQRYTGDEETT